MSNSAEWPLIGLFFRQNYAGGYRYLDNCGKLMVEIERDLDFIPKENAQPTGCKMVIPESGFEVTVTANELLLRQEGGTLDFESFSAMAEDLSKRVIHLFEPTSVVSNGTSFHAFKRFDTEPKSLSSLLGKWGAYEDPLAERLGMKPVTKSAEFTFAAGSYRLVMKINPASLRLNPAPIEAPHYNDTAARREMIRRKNIGADRFPRETAYGLLFDMDLAEDTPPPDGIPKQFIELKRLLESTYEILP